MPDSRLEAFFASERKYNAERKNALTKESLADIPIAYASCSIGCKASHTLPKKLDAIAKAGFTAIELSMPDLLEFANQIRDEGKREVGPYDFDELGRAATEVKKLCDSHNLKILVLQPFANFEGWPEGSPEREDAFTRLRGWIRIMQAAGTDMLQVGSSDSPAEKIGTDRSRFVKDLQELTDILAEKGLRVAYENWCWSTHAPDWKDVWDICQKVNRPNFGLCLDTFQSAGGEWGDPTTASGMVEDGRSPEQVTADWQASCKKLASTIPAEKIFFLQISDAYKPNSPFSKDVDESGLRPRGRWSHDSRPLPFKGYLPTVDFAKAVLGTGFRGHFSYEIFDGGSDGEGIEYEMEEFAREAMECQKKLLEACVDS
ncbi:hypothetical protein B0A48_07357 [Cryoendolithus antarcticus]|uniref:Xylose isomerase-like TIM barrel domain-containing protein n=1 Tax=Cryoendolithus antarcticus TaxID=1507870 RepID=A0A1V8T8I7_9PEZI|nr:hypothetical protein B0A48_07357 [Cryoendolithus antarcticus]